MAYYSEYRYCKYQYPENWQNSEGEMNLSALKLMYFGQFMSDLNKLGVKI